MHPSSSHSPMARNVTGSTSFGNRVAKTHMEQKSYTPSLLNKTNTLNKVHQRLSDLQKQTSKMMQVLPKEAHFGFHSFSK
jgi:hypothetical protein